MKYAPLFLLLSAVAVSAQTNQIPVCCHHPFRSFGDGRVANLTPLFQWWTAHANAGMASAANDAASDRPLPAWKRITGIRVGTVAYGWVLKAHIATGPAAQTNEQIILENPPAAEEQRYNAIKALLPKYSQQISNDQHVYLTDVKAGKNAQARAEADARSRNFRSRLETGYYSRLAAQKQNAAEAALNDQQKYEQARDLVQKQLSIIPSLGGQYHIDCFALEIGRTRQGLPVFDPGVMSGP